MLPNPPSSLGGTKKETKATAALFKRAGRVGDVDAESTPPSTLPFNPNTPLSRRSFISPDKTTTKKEPLPPVNKNPPKEKPTHLQTFLLSDRPLSSPIPVEAHAEFADIRSSHWPDTIAFLRRFKGSLLTYIPDGESHGALPVIHTYGVDGLTPATTAFPDPSYQDKGYGMYFSVNGFKSSKSRALSNLYCLNGFFADIDWPNKKNPPTNEKLAEFKHAVYEDLVFTIAEGREAFASDPLNCRNSPPPTAIVETKNGFHVYWLFDEPIFSEILRPHGDGTAGAGVGVEASESDSAQEGRRDFSAVLDAYRRIQANIIARFQADPQCKDATRVLRVPNSYHLKNPAEPFKIALRYFEPENVYSFEQGEEFWLHNPNALTPDYAFHHAGEFARSVEPRQAEVRLPRDNRINGGGSASLFQPAGAADSIDSDVVGELDRKWPKPDRPSYGRLISGVGIAEGTRNKALLIAASTLRASGYSEQAVIDRYKAGGYSGLPEYEIVNTVKSAFRGVVPYDFGWNDPVLADHVTLEEASKVRAITKEIMGERKAKKLAQSKQYAHTEPGNHVRSGDAGGVEVERGDSNGDALTGNARFFGESIGGLEHNAVRSEESGNDNSEAARHSENVENDSANENTASLEGEELTLTGIARLEGEYSIIDKPTQKRLFNIFDSIFVKNHPDIVSVDDVGFYKHVADKRYYEPMPIEAIRREVSELLSTLGCLDFRGTSQISAKVESLQAYRPIRMSREESENVLFGSMKNGTILNTLSGFVDFNTGLIVSDNQRLFVTSTLPVQYDDSRETTAALLEELCPRWMQFIREVSHSNVPGETENKMMLLQEMAGYCFTPFTSFQVAFLLLGGGANGKSTFLDAIKEIIGDNDTSTLSLADLSSQFRLSGLYRKRMNIIEEIPNSYFESDNLKKIISGQEITADRKYMQPIRFRPTAKLVFAVNQFPRVNDQTHALYRRFKTIPFNVTFTEATKDYELPHKLWAERDGIFRWAMQGWQRLRLAGSFTHSLEVDQSNEDFKEQNSPLVEYLLRDYIIYEEALEKWDRRSAPLVRDDYTVLVDVLYNGYRAFSKENGYGTKSRQAFMKEMSSLSHKRLSRVGLASTMGSVFVGLRAKKTQFNDANPKKDSGHHFYGY